MPEDIAARLTGRLGISANLIHLAGFSGLVRVPPNQLVGITS